MTNLRLEEVERDRKEGVWRITLGYDTAESAGPSPQNALSALLRDHNQRRAYKVVSLTDDSGEFISVKLRLL